MEHPNLKTRLQSEAEEAGFALCRVTHPGAISEVPGRLQAFLNNGYHGGMEWLADRKEWRGDPRN
ncbi:MAG: epoxyqueuosine reductase, partial [Pseudomonadota bacterium]